jgi:ribosomal protein S18 acetylase RimI-like enzyme
MIEIVEADLNLHTHGDAIIQLMEAYALDPMGGEKGLSDYVKTNLTKELSQRKSIHVILAFVDRTPAGLVIAIEGFSTFACKPLLNIHDLIVAKSYRRQGLAKLLLEKTEEIASNLGCCKLTLEVLEGNYPAQSVYKNFGFDGYQLNPQMGKALFWQKTL